MTIDMSVISLRPCVPTSFVFLRSNIFDAGHFVSKTFLLLPGNIFYVDEICNVLFSFEF